MADSSSMAVVAFVTSWFTPMSLFLFLNLMIGTLVLSAHFTISSKSKDPEHRRDDHQDSDSAEQQSTRAPSLLKRVKSFNFSQYRNFDHQQYTHQQYTEADHAPPLARAYSVLTRLKSVNINQFRFDRSAADAVHHQGRETEYTSRVNGSAPAQPLLQRLKSINLCHDEPNPESRPDPVQDREPPPLARVPSFLALVKSINFSLYGQENEYTPEETDPVHAEEHHVLRVNSDTNPSGAEAPVKLARKMKKSASHKSAFGHFVKENTVDDPVELQQRPESVREGRRNRGLAGDDDEEEFIDSKADDFIYKFRQQLKLQRMDSIFKYKEILTRSHAAD